MCLATLIYGGFWFFPIVLCM
uniref:Tumor rejection antigen n=1 Tax=Homo sapiens TaxID=9606 RepID=Q8WYR5_HUMAN|nr:tumor rejection antigen [Homo sapiens]